MRRIYLTVMPIIIVLSRIPWRFAVSFGRQMGTYPVLIGIPQKLAVGTVLSCTAVSYGARSLTALPYPVPVNRLAPAALKWIPGVSAKSASKLLSKMPFKDEDAFLKAVPGAEKLAGLMDFS